MSILSRIRDFVHECEIVRLFAVHNAAARNWHVPADRVRSTWNDYVRAIELRSSEQIVRLRKRNGAR